MSFNILSRIPKLKRRARQAGAAEFEPLPPLWRERGFRRIASRWRSLSLNWVAHAGISGPLPLRCWVWKMSLPSMGRLG